jgi:signal transduction histidine kinase
MTHSRKALETEIDYPVKMVEQWYRSPEFLAAVAAWIVIVLLLVYLLRRKQIASRIYNIFDKRLAKGIQTSRDLDDFLAQSEKVSTLGVVNTTSTYNNQAEMSRVLDKLSELLGRAIEEGISGMDTFHASMEPQDGFTEALDRATEQRVAPTSMDVTFSLVGETRDIYPLVRDEIYRIGCEAIRNAYAHSNAKHLTLDLTYGQDFWLRVFDNGCGIDFAALEQRESGPPGLSRMQKQAESIGGRLTIKSSASAGTEIHLRVPGPATYRKAI